jgi:MSHA biogenesis protein MshJ
MIAQNLYKIRLQLDRLSLRERYMLLVIIFALIILMAQGVLVLTGLDKHDQVISQVDNFKTEATAYQDTLNNLESATSNPRIVALQNSNQQLEDTIEELDGRIDKIASLLITPERMASVIKQLLNEQNKLSLERFNVLPAKRLQSSTDVDTIFYQHTIEIALTGEFEAFVTYLEKIEALPEELFWDDLLIKTESFPKLEFKLKVHTLSRQEEWLNV